MGAELAPATKALDAARRAAAKEAKSGAGAGTGTGLSRSGCCCAGGNLSGVVAPATRRGGGGGAASRGKGLTLGGMGMTITTKAEPTRGIGEVARRCVFFLFFYFLYMEYYDRRQQPTVRPTCCDFFFLPKGVLVRGLRFCSTANDRVKMWTDVLLAEG